MIISLLVKIQLVVIIHIMTINHFICKTNRILIKNTLLLFECRKIHPIKLVKIMLEKIQDFWARETLFEILCLLYTHKVTWSQSFSFSILLQQKNKKNKEKENVVKINCVDYYENHTKKIYIKNPYSIWLPVIYLHKYRV